MYIPDILRARVTWVSVLKMPCCPIPEAKLSVGDTGSTYWLPPLCGLAAWTLSDCGESILPARERTEPWLKWTLNGSKEDAVALSFCSWPSFALEEVKGSLSSYLVVGVQPPVELAGEVSPKPDP